MAYRMPADEQTDADLADHYATYNAFVKYGFWSVAHILLILALLAYFLGYE